jgi:hypothetical protein
MAGAHIGRHVAAVEQVCTYSVGDPDDFPGTAPVNLSFPAAGGQSCCTLVENQAAMPFLSSGLIVLQPAHAIMILALSGRASACFAVWSGVYAPVDGPAKDVEALNPMKRAAAATLRYFVLLSFHVFSFCLLFGLAEDA